MRRSHGPLRGHQRLDLVPGHERRLDHARVALDKVTRGARRVPEPIDGLLDALALPAGAAQDRHVGMEEHRLGERQQPEKPRLASQATAVMDDECVTSERVDATNSEIPCSSDTSVLDGEDSQMTNSVPNVRAMPPLSGCAFLSLTPLRPGISRI